MSDLLSTLKTRAKPTGKGKLQQDWYLFSQAADLIEQQQTRIAEQQKEIESLWETYIKVADTLGIDTEQARKTKGKPSAVYLSYINGLQQEREELAATVNRMLDITNKAGVALAMLPEGALGEVPDDHEQQGWFIRDELIYNLEQALKSTPRQNLNAIKREAVMEFAEYYADEIGQLYGWEGEALIEAESVIKGLILTANQRYPDKD